MGYTLLDKNINNNCFKNCINLSSLIIPSNIKNIGNVGGEFLQINLPAWTKWIPTVDEIYPQ